MEEQCCKCEHAAEIFQDDMNYCVECWQAATTPNIPMDFYN
ncbi:hypothetical protein [Nitrososphaera sp.]